MPQYLYFNVPVPLKHSSDTPTAMLWASKSYAFGV